MNGCRTCEECGVSIEHKKAYARFCSRRCKGKTHDRERRKTDSYKEYQAVYKQKLKVKNQKPTFRDTTRKCWFCTSEFTPKANNQIYCCKKCKQQVIDAAYRERHRPLIAKRQRERYQTAIYGSPTRPEEMHYDKYRRARAYGYRSGLEVQVANQLTELGVPFEYESLKVHYIKPSREAKYTPDYVLPNGIVIETKGKFEVSDRQKHLIIKDQHPNLDVRFVFSNSNTKISKNSKTSYAAWCEKHGFEYADKYIPKAWIDEPPDEGRLAALKGATCQ